ncbi:MAG: hypothetical protein ACC612_02825 [Methanomethylovorans sp.]|jgi:hypothetical protein|uniref:hypothetical protein n=1 Tax=Methanomethylovorans sp. TaxID=2758717 RepID=UPI00198293E8|nr:hypothetical protein [Methanomethylovorans sp.]
MGKKIDTIVGVIVVLLLIITIYGFSQQYVEVKEQQNRLDNPPFRIAVLNEDVKSHEITVEVLDANNSTLYISSYSIESGDFALSPVILTEKGNYSVKVTVDGNITKNANINFNEEKTLEIDIYPGSIDFGYSMP